MTKHRADPEGDIFTFIADYYDRHGVPAGVREIASGLGYQSTSAVHYHLQRMERAGSLRQVRRMYVPVS